MWYWPLIISTYTFEIFQSYRSIVFKYGVNALCRAHIISTLPLQNLSIYAAFRACFCTYFSELSDYWVQ